MKKSKLLMAIMSAAIITSGCSSDKESKEEVKQEQTKKDALDINNLTKENRKHPEFKYVTYSILKLKNDTWKELTDEKINNFINEWDKKRDKYHDKSLLIYNEDTKKGVLAKGTSETINYKEYKIDAPESEHFNWENPIETMFIWDSKDKIYTHIESKEKLDITK